MAIKDISTVSRNEYVCDVARAIFKSVDNMNSQVSSLVSAIISQASETTATEWENFFGLSYEPTWTLQDRRDRLIYTFNSKGFFTKNFLKNQANIFTNGQIDIIENFADYHFTIQFTSSVGTVPNLPNFEKMVNVNKPAHLTFDIKLRYRTWGELKQYTWGQLINNTWLEVREKPQLPL